MGRHPASAHAGAARTFCPPGADCVGGDGRRGGLCSSPGLGLGAASAAAPPPPDQRAWLEGTCPFERVRLQSVPSQSAEPFERLTA
ncbi:unnamed protein product [Prorocentrum cordatum]|uniref:Uncharacterized protein n=1 Tax=Prorocentrum cordatum TaxID=2364126 RepID=A0ABN9RKZ0_9DINO|nr:unnamed protein product [Polarella glacialis]